MIKEVLLFLLLLIMLVSTSVLAQPPGELGPTQERREFNWQTGNIDSLPRDQLVEGIKSGNLPPDRYNDPLIPWGEIDQSVVPADRIGSVPSDKVNVAQVSDKSKLTYDQVNHGDNYNKVGDVNLLNKNVRDRIVSERSKSAVETDTGGRSTQGRVYQDGFRFDQLQGIRIGDTFVSNAQGVEYRAGVLKIEKADAALLNDGHLILLEKLEKTDSTVKLDSADEVRAHCVRAKNVKKSVFEIKDTVKIRSDSGTSYPLRDCGGNDLEYQSTSDDNVISISQDSNAIIFGKNVVLKSNNEVVNLSNSEAQLQLLSR